MIMTRLNGKQISIIGYALRLPESNNPLEFHTNLLNKINMVTRDDRRWIPGYKNTPEYFGKIKQSLDEFDNIFFGIHGKQAEKLDPQLRLFLETTHEALIDAAILPNEIKGSEAGVYISSPFCDSMTYYLLETEKMSGYEITGCAQSMYANRLSFYYDIHGPSYHIDTACASSLTALHQALNDLKSGRCEFALVAASSIFINPGLTVGFNNLKMLSPDGFCKTFDKNANGYTRSEGVVTIVLTTNPKFVRYAPYAKILASHINTCGYNEKGIIYPNHIWQTELYKKITHDTKTYPSEVKYIECHGTGTVAGDTEEVTGIQNFFGDRKDLIVGSVKACMGHGEGVSGLAGLSKVLLSYETQTIYPQLHLEDRIPILGNLQVMVEPLKWKGGKAIINSFGFGGANASILIENVRQPRKKQKKPWHSLYFISSRTKEGLYQLKRELEKHPQQIPVFKDERYSWHEVVGIPDDPQIVEIENRPLYFIFSGNGSQWKGMGLSLINASSLFKKTIYKCGKDIPLLLEKGWQGPLNATRVLVAIQIGLVELIKSLGIKASGYVGYSAGEIAAGYASGATTLQETMAIAEARGRASEDITPGMMASVGLSQEAIQTYLINANKVCVACINSPRNITLSGDKNQLLEILQQLNNQEIFIREINTENVPYHSLLIDKNNVKSHLKNTVKKSKNRNKTWISAIQDYHPKTFTEAYHVESVTRAVDFMGAMNQIPNNAIALEIGPHAALRAIIRDCVPDIKYVSLLSRNENDLETFKKGIGRLWTLGVDIKVIPDKIRPPLSVRSKQTAWQRENFPIPRENSRERKYKKTFHFDLQNKDHYLLDHKVDNNPIFPATGYVYLFWQSFSEDQKDAKIVCIDNLKILRSVPLVGEAIKLDVFCPISGEYEITFNNEMIAKAKLSFKEQSTSPSTIPELNKNDEIDARTFYRFSNNIGLNYGKDFQTISKAFVHDNGGYFYFIYEFKHWISFLDGMLQASLLCNTSKELRLPTYIRHIELSENKAEHMVFNAYVNSISCGEILIEGMVTTRAPKKKINEPVIFQKEHFLLQGTTQMNEDQSNYVNEILHYGINKFKSIQDQLTEPHHEKIKQIVKHYQYEVNSECLAQFSDQPYFKLLEDCYKNVDALIQAPITTIANSPHYADNYHKDFSIDISFLEKCMSVIRENSQHKINLFEIGTGTGGFLKQIGHCLTQQDMIVCSDITPNRIIHNDITSQFKINYEIFDLNKEMSPEMTAIIGKADLIAASNALHVANNIESTLQSFYDLMKPGAFMLLFEMTSSWALPLFGLDKSAWNFNDEREFGLWLSHDSWKKLFETVKFKLICDCTDRNKFSCIYLIRKPFSNQYEIKNSPSIPYNEEWSDQIKNSKGPFIFCHHAPGGMAGFSRSLTKEGKRSISLCAENPELVMNKVMENALATNIVINDQLYTQCYVPETFETVSPKDIHFHIEVNELYKENRFKFVKNKPRSGKLSKVAFAAMNFRDVMLASGKITKESYLGRSKESSGFGIEFSGICDGIKVMGVALDSFANFVNSDLIWNVPENMSLEDAATIPVAYLTCYYSFFERAKIQPHYKVLIHGGTGAVGQAAIRIALDIGCEVFATCQQSKRDYLKLLFPSLDDAHISDSRSTQFEKQILGQTKGKGVDIILNSLADDKLQAGLRCLAQHGYFIEIGKYDLMLNTQIGMQVLLPNTTICGIDLDQILNDESTMTRLATLLTDGLMRGVVKPLDYKIFKCDELQDAFRYLGGSHHLGKVLIDMQGFRPPEIENRFYTYGAQLIVGGLGGFGMALAEWLVERGATHIILVSRKGIVNGEQKLFVKRLQNKNIKVDITTHDLTNHNDAKQFFEELPPLTGIYHLSVVLNDVLFDGMTKDKWEETVNSKITIGIQLDQCSRHHPIQQFVCFSSISSLGNAGQSNYAFSNNYLENLCYARKNVGLPALAIQWGGVDNVGIVANKDPEYIKLYAQSLGMSLQSIDSCLDYLETCMLKENVVNLVYQPFKIKHEQSLSLDKRDIIKRIGQILNIDLLKVPKNTSLLALGIDSLQFAEIQSLISHTTHEIINSADLSNMTVAELNERFGNNENIIKNPKAITEH